MPGGQEKFLAIADLEGWGYKSSDVRGYLAALSILQVQSPAFLLYQVDADENIKLESNPSLNCKNVKFCL